MKIGFIGYGNMAQAIATGLVEKKVFEPKDVFASARDFAKLEKNTKKIGINACKDNLETVKNADIVILAVKPNQIKNVVRPLSAELQKKIVISIAAGIFFDEYEEMFKSGTHHISVMPNTPIGACDGILVCESKNSLDEKEIENFQKIFEKIALIEFVDTDHFSVAGTLAGCSPAFTAMFMEALSDAAVKYGLDRKTSYRLAAQVIKGTGSLYLKEGKEPARMKDAVCSPGGTTIKGVTALEKNGFRNAVIQSIDAIEGK